MPAETLLHHLNTTLLLVMTISAPVLGVAAAVGLLVGLLQAVTQIQDQALAQTLKLLAVLATLALLGPTLVSPLLRDARGILDQFPAAMR